MKRTAAVLCGLAVLLAGPSGRAAAGPGPSTAQSRPCCATAWCAEQAEACRVACESRSGTSPPPAALDQCRLGCGEHARRCEECCRQPATQCWNPGFCW